MPLPRHHAGDVRIVWGRQRCRVPKMPIDTPPEPNQTARDVWQPPVPRGFNQARRGRELVAIVLPFVHEGGQYVLGATLVAQPCRLCYLLEGDRDTILCTGADMPARGFSRVLVGIGHGA